MNVVFLLSNQMYKTALSLFYFGATLTGGGRKMENVLHLTEIHTITENIFAYVRMQSTEFHFKNFTQPFWNVSRALIFSPIRETK